MSKHEIEIPELPEGWKPVAYRKALDTDTHVFIDGEVFEISTHPEMINPKQFSHLIVEKIQPRRIVLEETGETRPVCYKEWFDDNGFIGMWYHEIESSKSYKIWRVVKETDLSLTKDDSNLSLSVNELKQLDLYGMTDHAVTDKIRAFIKGK